MELLQDSDSSLATIGPHWPSSYPEYLSPHQDKDEQQRIVWARLLNQRSNLARSLKEQKERYQALRHELNPRTTQVESSHDPLYRDSLSSWGCLITGSLVTRSRRVLNAISCLSSQVKGTSLRVSSLRGFAILEKLGMNGR